MKYAENTAVVTAVTNRYDYLGSHHFTRGVDYYFFTDDVGYVPQGEWKVLSLPDIGRDPRRRSKLPKLNPHIIKDLQSYRYVIWIDGDMEILREEFVPEILSYLKRGFVVSPHFDGRDCAYGEATIRPGKYANEPLTEQVEAYEKEGFPHHYGLYECGVLARDMRAPGLGEVGRLWQEQNLIWSYQDQVSLPYCFWKTGFVPDVLPQSFRFKDWVRINAHTRED